MPDPNPIDLERLTEAAQRASAAVGTAHMGLKAENGVLMTKDVILLAKDILSLIAALRGAWRELEQLRKP